MASETDRSKIVDIIKGGATPSAFKPVSSNVFQPLPDTAFTGKVKHTTRTAPVIGGTPITRFAKPEKKSKGFGGAFGALIDVIDWPASIVRSTIKEVRDIGKPDQSFSLKDWWKQGGGGPFASDKMFMGEIMRETGSPLGPEGSGEELAKGLTLDILTDPITYLTFGIGAIPRALATAGKIPQVVKALNKAAGLAKTTDKANELRKAADRVQKTNSILSAGKALDHIGIKSGATLIIPGTGRLGRHFIEKPLSIATGGAVGRMARNARAKNVPSFVLPDTAFDVQRYAPQIAQSMKTIKKGDDFAKQALTKQGVPEVLQDSILAAAKFGRKSAITLPLTIPGTATAMSKIAPLPGMAFRWGITTKIGQTLDKALNYKAPIRALKLVDSDPDLNIAANKIHEASNMGDMAAFQFRRQLLGNPSKAPLGYRMAVKGAPETQGTGVMGLTERAKRFGISNEDMMRASDRPTFLRDGTLNPELPESFRRLGQQGADFHQELRQWWDDAARLTNEALGKTQLSGFANDLYAARYLNEAGQEILGGKGWRPPRTMGSDTPWNLRPTITPAQYIEEVAKRGEEVAGGMFKTTWMGRSISDELYDTGRSVRDQIDEITVDVLGKEEARQIFSNNFEEVAQRYIMDMERGINLGVVRKTLEDAGVGIPVTASGKIRLDLTDRLKTLTANASKFQDKIDAARVADRRLLELDELAEFGYPGLGSGFRSGPMLQLERDAGILLNKMNDFVSGNGNWIPKGLKATIRDLNSVKPLATTGWANTLDDYAGIANTLGYQVSALRRSVNGMKAALTKGGQTVPPDLNYVERSIASMESALAQMNGLMNTAALGDETIVAAKQMLRTLETGQVPKNIEPAMKKWADQYSEWVKLDDTTGSTTFLHQADEDYLTAAMNQIGAGELPDLAYLTKLVEQTAGQATEKASLYTELLEEVTFNMKRFEEITPSMMEGLEDARLLATKDVLTPDEFFNQQKYLQSAKEQIMDLETEIQSARRSADLGRRVSAAESQEEAIKMINTERGQQGFSNAYNEALSNQLTGKWLQGMAGVNVGEHAELFASAIYAAAKMNDPKALNKFWRGYGHILNYWKAQAVATPGFFMRNMVGAVWINSQIAGVEMGQHTKVAAMRSAAQDAAYRALKDQKYMSDLNKVARMTGKPAETIALGGLEGALSGTRYLAWELSKGKVGKTITLKGLPGGFRQVNSNYLKNFEKVLRNGIAEGGQAASEVVEKVANKGHYSLWKFWRPEFLPLKFIRKRNEDVEFMVRGALAMDVLEKGGDIATAQRQVNKFHFDYAELTPTEAKIKMVIPFWKWQKSILPVLLESVGKQPKAWSRMHQIKAEIEYMSDEEGIVPDYFLENLGVRLPWRMDGSQVYLLPDLPFKDLNRWLKEPSSPAKIFTEAAFPLAKLPIELWAGKQFFADIPLKGRLQQVPPVYENIPGLMPLLGILNKAQKNREGQWKMTDSDLYILDQMMPYLGRFRKGFPNEKKYQNEARRMTTWISVLFGGGLRVNTPEEQRNQLLRMQREDSEYYRDMLDLETREV